MRMGISNVLTADQSSEFKYHLNDEMMKLLNIQHQLTKLIILWYVVIILYC